MKNYVSVKRLKRRLWQDLRRRRAVKQNKIS